MQLATTIVQFEVPEGTTKAEVESLLHQSLDGSNLSNGVKSEKINKIEEVMFDSDEFYIKSIEFENQ